MEIKGCVGLVTGGNRGIGEGFVRVLLESGATKVYVGSRDPAAASHLVEQYPGRCVALELDVTDYDAVTSAWSSTTPGCSATRRCSVQPTCRSRGRKWK